MGSQGSFGVTDQQFGAGSQVIAGPEQRHFTSGGFSNMGPRGNYNPQPPQQSSITMRLLQQKQQRESQRSNGSIHVSDANNNGDAINLYGANPFGGL